MPWGRYLGMDGDVGTDRASRRVGVSVVSS